MILQVYPASIWTGWRRGTGEGGVLGWGEKKGFAESVGHRLCRQVPRLLDEGREGLLIRAVSLGLKGSRDWLRGVCWGGAWDPQATCVGEAGWWQVRTHTEE